MIWVELAEDGKIVKNYNKIPCRWCENLTTVSQNLFLTHGKSPRDIDGTEQLLLLVLALGAVTGSFILQPTGNGSLALPIPFTGIQVYLPEMCMSRRVLGVSCPGCGLTRSFVAAAHGDLAAAVRWNPMGPVLFLVVLFQIPYRAVNYLGLWRFRPWWIRFKAGLAVTVWPICGGLVVAWLIRML